MHHLKRHGPSKPAPSAQQAQDKDTDAGDVRSDPGGQPASEYPVPDAGFKPTLTRAEVRQDLIRAHARGQTARQQHDGQDPAYVSGSKTRKEVKAEAAAEAEKKRGQSPVDDKYFG